MDTPPWDICRAIVAWHEASRSRYYTKDFCLLILCGCGKGQTERVWGFFYDVVIVVTYVVLVDAAGCVSSQQLQHVGTCFPYRCQPQVCAPWTIFRALLGYLWCHSSPA